MVWPQVESLSEAGPDVVTARLQREDSTAVIAGDGVHGTRACRRGRKENVKASYRVGVAPTAPSRPISWPSCRSGRSRHQGQQPFRRTARAAPEQLGEARTNAPLRIRTLDRVVSASTPTSREANFAGVSLAWAEPRL